MGNIPSCDAVDMQDTVSRYVSGHLAEEEATAFEQHLEGCERCWGEVQMALQVRAATRVSAPSDHLQPRRQSVYARRWLGAVAASVVLAVAGWWVLDNRQTPTEITRGGNAIAITASRLPHGGVRVSWPAVEGASQYRLAVSLVDGTPLVSRATDRVELTLTPADLPTPVPSTLLIELRAEDALGTRLVDQGPATVSVSVSSPPR